MSTSTSLPQGETVLEDLTTLERVVWRGIRDECDKIRGGIYSRGFAWWLLLVVMGAFFWLVSTYAIFYESISFDLTWLLSLSDGWVGGLLGLLALLLRLCFLIVCLVLSWLPMGFISRYSSRRVLYLEFTFLFWVPFMLGFLDQGLHLVKGEFVGDGWMFVQMVGGTFVNLWLSALLISPLLIFMFYVWVWPFTMTTVLLFLTSFRLFAQQNPYFYEQVFPSHGELVAKVIGVVQPKVEDWSRHRWAVIQELASQREEALNTQKQFVSFWFVPLGILGLLTSFVPEVFDVFFEQVRWFITPPNNPASTTSLQWIAVLFFVLLMLLGAYYFYQAYKTAYILEIIRAICVLRLADEGNNLAETTEVVDIVALNPQTVVLTIPSRIFHSLLLLFSTIVLFVGYLWGRGNQRS